MPIYAAIDLKSFYTSVECVEHGLDLLNTNLVVADQIVLNIGYDHTGIPEDYSGKLVLNHYGKKTPKPAHGSVNLRKHTASTKIILSAMMQICDQILDKELLVRRLNVAVNHVIYEKDMPEEDAPVQYGLFDDVDALEKKRDQEKAALAKERKLRGNVGYQGKVREECCPERHELSGRRDSQGKKWSSGRSSCIRRKNMDDFSAIMNLPHHVSKKRRQMTLEERAVQFSAFAALSGYDEEIDETARLTSPREAMSEDDIADLDAAFQRLIDSESEHPTVTITYFQPDERKEGGRYAMFSGVFRHFDATENKLAFTDGTRIPVVSVKGVFQLSLPTRGRELKPRNSHRQKKLTAQILEDAGYPKMCNAVYFLSGSTGLTECRSSPVRDNL